MRDTGSWTSADPTSAAGSRARSAAGFQVSSDPGLPRFENIDATCDTEFSMFSPARLFTPIGSTITDTHLFVPGTTRDATNAFGVILTDADRAGCADVTCYDDLGAELLKVAAPVAPDHGLSFVGVRFPDGERVGRVGIRSGTAPLALNPTDGDATDVVALDDVIHKLVVGRSEAAKAKITLRRSGRVVGTARTVSAKAGATVLTLRASRSPRAGSYSLRVVVSDAAGNATTKTLSLRIVR